MVTIETYLYAGHPNKVGKNLGVATGVMTGLFFDVFDTLNARLVLRLENVNFNYLFVRELGKYYFVENYNILENKKFELNLSLDVLETYKEVIKAATATITQRENANPYANNRSNTYDLRPFYNKINFSENAPFSDNGVMVMVTIKG